MRTLDLDTKLNYKDYKRNPDMVKSKLTIVDHKLITTEDLDIFVPLRFTISDLLTIGEQISVVGLFPMVIDKNYTVCNVNAMITINPSTFKKVSFDENKYYQFHFEKDSIVFSNTNLVKSDAVIYPLFNELIAQGNVPWYINYTDYGDLFKTAEDYANSNITTSPQLMYILVGMQSRSTKDRSVYYRQVIQDYKDIEANPPEFVPLKSVIFSATDTVNKLAGSYFSNGVVSALSNPSERVERLESLLKA